MKFAVSHTHSLLIISNSIQKLYKEILQITAFPSPLIINIIGIRLILFYLLGGCTNRIELKASTAKTLMRFCDKLM